MTFSQYKHLSVETVSGTVLGKISDIVLESNGQLVAQYIVKGSLLGGQLYTLNRDQVIRITTNKMIVDDSVVKDIDTSKSISASSIQPQPVAMRKIGE